MQSLGKLGTNRGEIHTVVGSTLPPQTYVESRASVYKGAPPNPCLGQSSKKKLWTAFLIHVDEIVEAARAAKKSYGRIS